MKEAKKIKKINMYRIVKRVAGMLCMLLCLCICYQGGTAKVQAAGGIIETPNEFKSLEGNGKYIDSEQYEYRIDIEKTGVLDSGHALINSIENALFGMEVLLAKAAVLVFYYCMSFNASGILSGFLGGMQATLHTAIFEPALYIALAATAIKLLKRLLQRNFAGAIQDCGYVIIIMILATLVVNKSDTVLTTATDISKSIGVDAMVGLNNSLNGGGAENSESYVDNYAVEAAGLLWDNMIHQLWLQLEFKGENVDVSLIDGLLSASSVEERERLATESGKDCFAKERAGEGLGLLLMYLIPLIIKAVIYIVLAAVQIFFQIMAVFFVLLAPIILVVSVFPGYDSMIIEVWLKKMLEFEIGIIVITMIIAFLVFLDNFMLTLAYGWLICFVMQIVIAVSMYLGRSQIFGMFSKLQRAVQSPHFAAASVRNAGSMNNVRKTGDSMRKSVMSAGRTGGEYVAYVAGVTRRHEEREKQRRSSAKDYSAYNLEQAVEARRAVNEENRAKSSEESKTSKTQGTERRRPYTKAAQKEQEDRRRAPNIVDYRKQPNVYVYRNLKAKDKEEPKESIVKREAEQTNEIMNRQSALNEHTTTEGTARIMARTAMAGTVMERTTEGNKRAEMSFAKISMPGTSIPETSTTGIPVAGEKKETFSVQHNEPDILIRPKKGETRKEAEKRVRINAKKTETGKSARNVTFSSPNIRVRERTNTTKARAGLNDAVAEKQAEAKETETRSKEKTHKSSVKMAANNR